MPGVVLEVAVSDPRDVAGRGRGRRRPAARRGARAHVRAVARAARWSAAIGRESELPLFVLLRLNDTWTTTGGEFARLIGLAEDYLACGATGVAFGFLDADLEIDTETCSMLLATAPATCPGPSPARSTPRSTRGARGAACATCRGWWRCGRPARRRACPWGTTTCWPSVTPGDRTAADARAAGWRPSRCRGCSAPASPAPPRRRRSGPAARPRRTSTPTYVRSWRTLVDDRAGLADDPDRPAQRAGPRAAVVPPGQRHVVRRAARLRRGASASPSGVSTATTTTCRPSGTTTSSPPARSRSPRAS